MANDKPPGLLSFLYHITYDTEVNAYFHEHPDDALNKFQLSKEVKEAVKAMGDVHAADEVSKQQAVVTVMFYLGKEILEDEYKKMW